MSTLAAVRYSRGDTKAEGPLRQQQALRMSDACSGLTDQASGTYTRELTDRVRITERTGAGRHVPDSIASTTVATLFMSDDLLRQQRAAQGPDLRPG
jgi:hypothetical protein